MKQPMNTQNIRSVTATTIICMGLIGCGPDYIPTPKRMVTLEGKQFSIPLNKEATPESRADWVELDTALRQIKVHRLAGLSVACNVTGCFDQPAYGKLVKLLEGHGVAPEKMNHRIEVEHGKDVRQVMQLTMQYRVVAFPKNCPDWKHTAMINSDNGLMANHGCASAINLGLMLADKNDLLASAGHLGADTESTVRAVEGHYGVNGAELVTITSESTGTE